MLMDEGERYSDCNGRRQARTGQVRNHEPCRTSAAGHLMGWRAALFEEWMGGGVNRQHSDSIIKQKPTKIKCFDH